MTASRATSPPSCSTAVPPLWRSPGAIVIALSALLAHSPCLSAGYIWLDHAHLERGLALPSDGVMSAFTRGFAQTGFYRPLLALSFAVENWFSAEPWLHHVTNLLLHLLAAWLVALVSEGFGSSRRAQLLAGACFALHPLSALVAGGIAFRSESLALVSLLGLILAQQRRWPLVAGSALLLGGLTKESVLFLAPGVVLLTLQSTRRESRGLGSGGRPSAAPLLFAEGLAFSCLLLLRWAFAPEWRASFPAFSVSEALGTRLAALAKSLRALAALPPWDNSVCDAFSVTSLTSAPALVGLWCSLLLAYAAWRWRGLAALFALALLPALQIVPVMRFWSPHYLYIPLAFLSMGLGQALDRLASRQRYALALVLPIWGLCSFRAEQRLAQDESLWLAEVARDPTCREAQYFLGEVRRQQQRWEQAAAHYQAAIRRTPGVLSYVDLGAAFTNLGVVRLEQRQAEPARAAFASALELGAQGLDERRLVHNLATAELMAGDAHAAEQRLATETARPDAFPESLWIRAKALRAVGQEAEARRLTARLASASQAAAPFHSGSRSSSPRKAD